MFRHRRLDRRYNVIYKRNAYEIFGTEERSPLIALHGFSRRFLRAWQQEGFLLCKRLQSPGLLGIPQSPRFLPNLLQRKTRLRFPQARWRHRCENRRGVCRTAAISIQRQKQSQNAPDPSAKRFLAGIQTSAKSNRFSAFPAPAFQVRMKKLALWNNPLCSNRIAHAPSYPLTT